VQRRFHVKTVGAVKGEQSELAEVERPRSLQDTLNSLTSSIWNKMDKAQKSEIWQFVGLTAAGKNLDVCREDSTLKEGNPMVGACSYGDHCTVKTPTATCLNRSIKTIVRVSGKRGPNAGDDEQGG